MKRIFIAFTAIMVSCSLMAQDTLKAVYKNGSIEFSPKKLSLVKGKTYLVELKDINSAHHVFKLETKFFEISTALPEVLKPIAPGISSSVSFNALDPKLINDLNTRMLRLYKIKELSDELHKKSIDSPNVVLAKKIYAAAVAEYQAPNDEALREAVGGDVAVLNATAEALKSLIPNLKKYNADLVSSYAVANSRAEELKKNNYPGFADYIIASLKAVKFRKSKTFTANKDITELKLILVDKYTKDTLYNNTQTAFHKGDFGLSFSTGFFHTRFLSDVPYYLEARPDGQKAVKGDESMKNDLSIGGFGHLFYRADTWLRIGPGIGLSISPFDGKTRYLAGGGILLGREKMVGITFGKAWTKVKQLSSQVQSDANGRYLPASATAVPTYDKLHNSWFFGLSYNIASTRK
ncbi:hypothetical protein [Pedobacter sp.]|uniref:hypothetical protein n=1 Tax=Pedobacter sp. TaxID=1411316 RepID=UPI003BAC2739